MLPFVQFPPLLLVDHIYPPPHCPMEQKRWRYRPPGLQRKYGQVRDTEASSSSHSCLLAAVLREELTRPAAQGDHSTQPPPNPGEPSSVQEESLWSRNLDDWLPPDGSDTEISGDGYDVHAHASTDAGASTGAARLPGARVSQCSGHGRATIATWAQRPAHERQHDRRMGFIWGAWVRVVPCDGCACGGPAHA